MTELGRVTRIDRGRALVAVADGHRSVVDTGDPVLAVGDEVRIEGERLVELLPRRSALTRLSHEGDAQLVAANVDVVLVVAGLDRPVKAGRLLRATTQAWDAGATPVVVLTKADLADPAPVMAELAGAVVGVEALAVSAVTGAGITELADRLGRHTAVMLGESGAGKSSLINALAEAHEKVGEVREGDHKGRHTTTWRQLVPLPGGGAVIDTPGVRSLGLWTDADTVDAAFTDIAELAEGCRFRDCAHDAEPGCAVRAALEDGALAEARFDQYHALRREAAALDRRADPTSAKREGRRMGAMMREVRDDRRRQGRDPGGAPP